MDDSRTSRNLMSTPNFLLARRRLGARSNINGCRRGGHGVRNGVAKYCNMRGLAARVLGVTFVFGTDFIRLLVRVRVYDRGTVSVRDLLARRHVSVNVVRSLTVV